MTNLDEFFNLLDMGRVVLQRLGAPLGRKTAGRKPDNRFIKEVKESSKDKNVRRRSRPNLIRGFLRERHQSDQACAPGV